MLSEIKKYYHLKSSSLASLLHKSVSFIYALNNNSRRLSIKDINLIKPYYDALRLNTPIEELAIIDEVHTSGYHIKKEIRQLTHQLESKQKELKEIIKNRADRQRGLYACHLLQDYELPYHQKKWISLRKRHLVLDLEELSVEKEVLLKAKIVAIKAQLDVLQHNLTN